jgi:4-amino-4-deoxy-L-arabinose transferase-like glycosyltransferase
LTSDVLLLALFNALLLAAGCGVTGALGWWRGRAVVRVLGLSYLAGVAAFGVLAQLLYVCGASLATWQIVAVCALLAAGSAGAVRGRPLRRPAPTRWRVVALVVAGMLVLLAVDLWFQPLWAYDAWTFWTPKAHALWALGLDARWFTQANLTSPDYPILLPSIEAAGFHFTGYEQSLLDLQSLLFFAAFLRAVYELAHEHADAAVLWAVLAMLAIAPSVADQLAAAEADVPVAALFATAGLCGARWLLTGERRALALAAVVGAGTAATKVEGTAFVIALFLVLAIVAAGRRRAAAVEPVAAGLAALAVGIVPWRVWLAVHEVHNQASAARVTGVSFLAHHAGRVPESAAYMLWKMLDPRAWLLVVPLFVAACLLARRRAGRLVAYATATAVLAFASLVFAYWSTRLGLHYQLTTSARRVVTSVVFFCAATTPLLARA